MLIFSRSMMTKCDSSLTVILFSINFCNMNKLSVSRSKSAWIFRYLISIIESYYDLFNENQNVVLSYITFAVQWAVAQSSYKLLHIFFNYLKRILDQLFTFLFGLSRHLCFQDAMVFELLYGAFSSSIVSCFVRSYIPIYKSMSHRWQYFFQKL